MNTLNIYPFCEALANGLLHSLWLFPLLVGLDWLVARQLRQSRHRYLCHLLTLLTCLGAFLGLVGWRWWTVTRAWSDANFLEAEIGETLTIQITDSFQKLGLETTNDWTIYLAAAYAAGLLFVLARYGNRYLATRQMRRGGLLPTPEYRTLFARLKAEVIPNGRADWRITDRVSNVLVVGIVRPVILFPVGLVNQLTPEEVTAILRHELTHLRRYDPLWNAVQELVRALFFYHPVVYWLCGELDREREFACDDAVIRQTNPKLYARALLRVANYSLSPKIPLTMAATNVPDFTQRIQRLFSPDAAEHRPGLPFTSRSAWLSPLAVLPVFLFLVYAVVNPYQLGAQAAVSTDEEVIISGIVTDGVTGSPLIGTAIVVPDTETGTITDFDGAFNIRLTPGKEQLIFSYLGYRAAHFMLYPLKTTGVQIKLYKDKAAEIEVADKATQVILLEEVGRDYGGSQPGTDADREPASDLKPTDQEVRISGKVVDALTGNPLIGAAVMLPAENTGTVTDLNGDYTLKAPSGNVMLSYSYTGYPTADLQYITQNTAGEIDLMMYTDRKASIVIGGDGNSQVMRLDRTGANGEQEKPVILAGRVTDGTDNPFYQKNVLMLIDGVRHTGKGFGDLQPEEIESIDVLKDKGKIEALGFGTDFEGAILIKTKKKD